MSFMFSEYFGRKRPLFAGTTIAILGAVIQTAANGVPMFIVGRIISGVGTGINTTIIPIWQAETLPAKTRERFGSFQYLLVCFGASVSYWMNYGLSYVGGQFEWRFAVAAQIIFATILLGLIPLMPESPRWLMNHNRISEAMDTLLRMHGTTDENDEEIQTEVKLINQAIELESLGQSVGWSELFKNHPETQNFRRIMLGWVSIYAPEFYTGRSPLTQPCSL
jgi:MFS family permease